MTQYRKDISVRVGPLTGYIAELLLLAAGHASALRLLLPNGEADLVALEEKSAALLLAHDGWLSRVRALGDAKTERDELLPSALEIYGRTRLLIQHIRRTKPNGSTLAALVKGCPAPTDLAIADVPSAMGYLADGIDDKRDFLASTAVGPAQAAELRAGRDALARAISARSAAEDERGRASGARWKAKEALIKQLRLVEPSLLLVPGDKVRASIQTIRARHLPRISRASASDRATEAQRKADEAAEEAEVLSERNR